MVCITTSGGTPVLTIQRNVSALPGEILSRVCQIKLCSDIKVTPAKHKYENTAPPKTRAVMPRGLAYSVICTGEVRLDMVTEPGWRFGEIGGKGRLDGRRVLVVVRRYC